MERKMEHENEIFGTVLSVIFAAVVVAMSWHLWSSAPLWLAVVGTAALGGTALWALVKVASYWIRKFKDRKSGK